MLDPFKSRRVVAAVAAGVAALVIAFLVWRIGDMPFGHGPTASQEAARPSTLPRPADQAIAGSGANVASVEADGSAASSPAKEMQPAASVKPDPAAAKPSSPTQGAVSVRTPQDPSASASPEGPEASHLAGNATVARSGLAASDETAPRFDIVRVSPDGSSVVAARAAPNSDVVLMDGATEIARAKADGSGQVAFVPPSLPPGGHSLSLSVTTPGGAHATSSQSVAVSVPEQPKEAPMVAVLQPGEQAKVLSGPVAGGSASAPSAQKTEAAPVAIQAVEAEEAGSFFASGQAAPNSQCRIYLNGAFVATVTADGKGVWSLKIKRGMQPGRYAVRADQVEGRSGSVTARAEVPFDYPALPPASRAAAATKAGPSASSRRLAALTSPASTGAAALAEAPTSAAPAAMPSAPAIDAQASAPTAPAAPPSQGAGSVTSAGSAVRSSPLSQSASSAQSAPAAATAIPVRSAPVVTALAQPAPAPSASPATDTGGPLVIDELVTAKVIHGDTLWRISRKMLGHGLRYTQIYAANSQQIRNPRLIYPGQVFVMPQTEIR